MTKFNAYTGYSQRRSMHLSRFIRYFLIIFLFIALTDLRLTGQENQDFEEILVYADIPKMGGFELPALIKGTNLYISVTDLFDFLKVRNIPSADLDSISGFFINRNADYLIDYNGGKVKFQERVYTVSRGDIVRTETSLYLKSDYFGRIFGLECLFSFRSLMVTISSKSELPLIKEMKLAEMRKNLTTLKGETKADTSIGRTHPLFRFGMADWSVYASEEFKGKTDASVNLSLGAMVAGGEFTSSLNYNTVTNFQEKQQYYLWRYVDNDFKPLRQVMAGKINSGAVSSLFAPVVGVQLTNTPTTYRRSFGTYKLSDNTEPGWIVELYVNNVLVDYTTADASGFFSFDVPMVYGNTSVKLKFYGPWGEERVREQNINIPYSFLPERTLEYNISAGFVEDTSFSRFSRATVNYGLLKSVTLGAGMEYLSSVSSGPVMPFVTGSFRATNNLILAGEYTHGVRAKGILQFRMPSNLQLDVNYIHYAKGQTAIRYNYLEERRATLSVPLRIGKLSSYQRFGVNQVVMPSSVYTTGEWIFSGSVYGVSTNLSTYALIVGKRIPYVYSNLALSFRLPAKFTLLPQVQYGYNKNGLMSARLRVEKVIGTNAFVHAQYERNLMNGLNLAEVGIKYDFSFAQAGFSMRQYNSRTSLIQYARGSIIADTKTGYVKTDNRPNVGRGGITIIPYLDINGNKGRDPGEPRAAGLNVHANGGRVIRNDRDTTIRVLGLEPYTNCYIELDGNGFESVSWQIPVKTIGVTVDPEILKTVEIPISVSGEASGKVLTSENGIVKGLARIILLFYNQFNEVAGRTLSEDDGYYSYFGLPAGDYTVMPDTVQLKRLGMRSTPAKREFTIKPSREGEYVFDLDFALSVVKRDTTPKVKPEEPVEQIKPVVEPEKPVVKKDTMVMVVHEVTQELVTIEEDSYAVQLGAFRRKANAEAYRKNLEALLGRKVEIVIENDMFKVRVSGMKEREEVDKVLGLLKKNGISELWLITLRAKQKQWVLITREDTVTTVKETMISADSLAIGTRMGIQLGAFRRQNNAVELQKLISSKINKPVVILNEDGYYKVRVTGFENREELDRMIPVLRKLGMKDIWVPAVLVAPPVIKKPVQQIPDQKKDTVIVEQAKPEVVKPEQVIVKPDTLVKPPEIKIRPDSLIVQKDTVIVAEPEQKPELPAEEVKPEPVKPKISLHVGEFRKRPQALRAQKKIASKLDVNVDIYLKWDSYHLVITGFFKREDTFRFYPELAGMGYTNIYVIQEK